MMCACALLDADSVGCPGALPPSGDADDVLAGLGEAALLAKVDGVLHASVHVLGPVVGLTACEKEVVRQVVTQYLIIS